MWVTNSSLKEKEKQLPVACLRLAAAPLIREENSSLEKLDSRIRTSVSRHLWLHYDTRHSNTTCLFKQKLVSPDTQLRLSPCHATALDREISFTKMLSSALFHWQGIWVPLQACSFPCTVLYNHPVCWLWTSWITVSHTCFPERPTVYLSLCTVCT